MGMSGGWNAPGGFFADADFDFETRIVLGAAAAGIGDVGWCSRFWTGSWTVIVRGSTRGRAWHRRWPRARR
jgi:hypothetical protein